MSGSVALDVVIGLVFIYLLYSLLASIIQEIISTNLNLRSKNLRKAISRMLNDEHDLLQPSFKKKVIDRLELFLFGIKNESINKFYSHQEISCLGKTKRKRPSAISSGSFTKVILDEIKKTATDNEELEKIKSGLKVLKQGEGEHILGKDTSHYVESMLEDAQYDLDKFKELLNNWFDRSMEHSSEWYKQRIQIILFFVSFGIALVFNADTFTIITNLSVDKDLRNQMVQLASDYVGSNNNGYSAIPQLKSPDTVIVKNSGNTDSVNVQLKEYSKAIGEYNKRLDSLLAIKGELQKDIDKANSIMGSRSWLPDSIGLDAQNSPIYPKYVETDLANLVFLSDKGSIGQGDRYIHVGLGDQMLYWLFLLRAHFFGYLITALALSLGAPFWFDLLNKLMQLRGNISKKTLRNLSTGKSSHESA